MMKLPQPIGHNILCKPFASDEKSAGGILVPESFRETSDKMLVLAVGGGTTKLPMQFIEGQTIFRIKGAGDELLIDGEKYFLIKQTDVLASS